MRKSLTSRIIGLAVIYCIVFCILIIIQFSNKGNFSISVGAMTIRGRYLEDTQVSSRVTSAEQTDENRNNISEAENTSEENPELNLRAITGGIKVVYGGLEFSLKEERGKGLTLINNENTNMPVNPEFMAVTDNTARFILPGGTAITFNSTDTARGPELQINAELADNISEINIPISPRRSSLVRDSGQLGIMYSGVRYVFSSLGEELETGVLSLSRDNSFISYRSRGRQRAFDPEEYIIAQEQNYTNVLRSWQESNFAQWNQNASNLQNEDDIIAYLSQTIQRGNFLTAVRAIPADFPNSSRHSYRSSGYVGGMTGAYRTFISAESEKSSRITRLTRGRSIDILKEEHILDYLFTRSSVAVANEVIEIIHNIKPDVLIPDHCLGLLEIFYDIRQWRPEANNPIEHLTEQMLILISESLSRDTENDAVYASNSEGINLEYSFRLGKGLIHWAEATGNNEWAAIGRSLVLSAIVNGNAGRLFNIHNPTDYYPRAAWLSDSGHWAWTVSPSVNMSFTGNNMNLAVTFPVNMTHHLIIRGVRPFIRIQIHNIGFRSDSQFERYDSSGWVYYPDEQTLVLRLRHRANVETVRIIYQEVSAAPTPSPSPQPLPAPTPTPAPTPAPVFEFAPGVNY